MVISFDIETTGLDPYESMVIVIRMKKGKKVKQWKIWEIGDEAKMILEVVEEITKTHETIVGYNNLKFDVPFMLERLRILGKFKQEFWEMYNKKWFDLYQYLGNDRRSLNHWLSKARIKRKYPDITGRDIPILYSKKEYEKILAHNFDDLISSEKLFKFLKKINPALIPFD
jgi:Predicted exonuclease